MWNLVLLHSVRTLPVTHLGIPEVLGQHKGVMLAQVRGVARP